MVVIKRVGVMSAGKVSGAIGICVGLFIGAFVSLFSLSGLALNVQKGGPQLPPVFMGVGAVILLPVFYGVFGFFSGAIYAGIYNVISGFVGGIEVEFTPTSNTTE